MAEILLRYCPAIAETELRYILDIFEIFLRCGSDCGDITGNMAEMWLSCCGDELRNGLERIELERIGLERIGLERIGLERIGLEKIGLEGIGLDWKRMERIVLERIGLD